MSQPVFTPVFEVLNERIQELPENFKDFAISECAWNEAWYNLYKQYPEMCSIEDQMTLLKIANDLAYDLLALITRCKQSREELFENKHVWSGPVDVPWFAIQRRQQGQRDRTRGIFGGRSRCKDA